MKCSWQNSANTLTLEVFHSDTTKEVFLNIFNNGTQIGTGISIGLEEAKELGKLLKFITDKWENT